MRVSRNETVEDSMATKSRKSFNPGVQFNIYRSTLPTEFARAVLHQLLTEYAEDGRQSEWTSATVANLLSSKHCVTIPVSDTPANLLELDAYDDKRVMEKV